MKQSIFLGLLFSISTLMAQETVPNPFETPNMYTPFLFDNVEVDNESNFDVWIAVDKVNMRQSDSETATVVANLPLATPVKLIKKSDKTFQLNGLTASWYQVQTPDGKEGYVWGGFLTALHVQANHYQDGAEPVYFVLSIARRTKESETFAQIRAVQNGKEIAKKEFKIFVGEGYYATFKNEDLSYAGFGDTQAGIRINSFYPACGYGTEDLLMFWTGTAFYEVISTSSSGEAGSYHTENLIMPGNGGVKGHIIFIEEDLVSSEEDEMRTDYQSYSMTLYGWKKHKLEKVQSQSKVLVGK